VEIYRAGKLEGRPYNGEYVANFTVHLYEFYRPNAEAAPNWQDILADLKQFAKENNIKIKEG
jgi:hypothetical protein